MRRASEFKTKIQRVINKSANAQRFATALRVSRATQLPNRPTSPALGTNKSESIQHALYVRWTCVRNALDGR